MICLLKKCFSQKNSTSSRATMIPMMMTTGFMLSDMLLLLMMLCNCQPVCWMTDEIESPDAIRCRKLSSSTG